MAKRIQKESTIEEKFAFADYLRKNRSYEKLRKISASYVWACDNKLNQALGFQRALERNQVSDFYINGRQITFKQARIVYELVNGRYGGLNYAPDYAGSWVFCINLRQPINACLREQDERAREN